MLSFAVSVLPFGALAGAAESGAGDGSGGGSGVPVSVEGVVFLSGAKRLSVADGHDLSIAASADGTLADTGSVVGDLRPDTVCPDATGFPKIRIDFNKAVGCMTEDDIPNAEANAARIHLLDASGQEVDGYDVSYGWFEDRRSLFVTNREWLAPLSSYQVVVDAGILARNGVDALEESFSQTFMTTSLCDDNVDLLVKIAFCVCAGIVCLGLAVQAVRMWKSR